MNWTDFCCGVTFPMIAIIVTVILLYLRKKFKGNKNMGLRKFLDDNDAFMVGLPLRMVIGSIILAGFIGIPKILSMFGISHPVLDFLIMPIVAFFLFVLVFSVYLANLFLNPARAMILIPGILVVSFILTWAIYVAA